MELGPVGRRRIPQRDPAGALGPGAGAFDAHQRNMPGGGAPTEPRPPAQNQASHTPASTSTAWQVMETRAMSPEKPLMRCNR